MGKSQPILLKTTMSLDPDQESDAALLAFLDSLPMGLKANVMRRLLTQAMPKTEVELSSLLGSTAMDAVVRNQRRGRPRREERRARPVSAGAQGRALASSTSAANAAGRVGQEQEEVARAESRVSRNPEAPPIAAVADSDKAPEQVVDLPGAGQEMVEVAPRASAAPVTQQEVQVVAQQGSQQSAATSAEAAVAREATHTPVPGAEPLPRSAENAVPKKRRLAMGNLVHWQEANNGPQ